MIFGGIAGGAELLETLFADLLHPGDGGLEIFARIEFALVVEQHLADVRGGGEAQVGVDIHLAHAVLDAAQISSTGTP